MAYSRRGKTHKKPNRINNKSYDQDIIFWPRTRPSALFEDLVFANLSGGLLQTCPVDCPLNLVHRTSMHKSPLDFQDPKTEHIMILNGQDNTRRNKSFGLVLWSNKNRCAINKEKIWRKSKATPGLAQRTFRTIRFERPGSEVHDTNGTGHDLLQDWDRHICFPLRVRQCICLCLWGVCSSE